MTALSELARAVLLSPYRYCINPIIEAVTIAQEQRVT
jgi:hypothetical protein